MSGNKFDLNIRKIKKKKTHKYFIQGNWNVRLNKTPSSGQKLHGEKHFKEQSLQNARHGKIPQKANIFILFPF